MLTNVGMQFCFAHFFINHARSNVQMHANIPLEWHSIWQLTNQSNVFFNVAVNFTLTNVFHQRFHFSQFHRAAYKQEEKKSSQHFLLNRNEQDTSHNLYTWHGSLAGKPYSGKHSFIMLSYFLCWSSYVELRSGNIFNALLMIVAGCCQEKLVMRKLTAWYRSTNRSSGSCLSNPASAHPTLPSRLLIPVAVTASHMFNLLGIQPQPQCIPIHWPTQH